VQRRVTAFGLTRPRCRAASADGDGVDDGLHGAGNPRRAEDEEELVALVGSEVRLSLGRVFLFLISAEAIAAESGLGYRIFLVRRYLAMDVILPYVAWITLLAFLMDFGLAKLARGAFAWAYVQERR